jgi:hypothetical protein
MALTELKSVSVTLLVHLTFLFVAGLPVCCWPSIRLLVTFLPCSHSNLLLPLYDEEGEPDSSSSSADAEPVAVLELAMHEVDVDFTQTCTTLREVAQVSNNALRGGDASTS